jgi:hypothetical protein
MGPSNGEWMQIIANAYSEIEPPDFFLGGSSDMLGRTL